LLLETLRYADEVNKAQSYFREIGDHKPDEDMLDLAAMLIEKKTGKFDPTDFHNRYVDALKGLIAEKQKHRGEKIIQEPEGPPPKGSNVIDLMAALKKSVESGGGGGEKAASKAKPAPRSKARPRSASTPKRKAAGGRK
jgi:DNA end-binding protein Ku